MSTLLVYLNGNRTLNATIFPPYLYVYDDLLIYKRRKWFWLTEVTISYNQIAQVILITGIFFNELKIITESGENLRLRFIPKDTSAVAKRIIDQKIYYSHAKHKPGDASEENEMKQYERGLRRLNSLKESGRINKRQFDKMKTELLSKAVVRKLY